MEKIKLTIDFEKDVSFSYLSRSLFEINRIFNLTSRIDNELASKLSTKNEFSTDEFELIFKQIEENSRLKKSSQVIIQKLSMNSPLEILILCDSTVHIAIILLGGKRTGPFTYEIPKGIIAQVIEIFKSLRNNK